MDGSVLEEKSSFKMLGLTFSSNSDWGSYIISIAKIASKKVRALIHSLIFLSLEVALYLYKSTIQTCMEYYCHSRACALSCYLDLLDKLQKRICRTVGFFFFNWDSLHARLNSHYVAWSYKKNKHKKVKVYRKFV